MKKIISIALALVMAVSLVSMVWATEDVVVAKIGTTTYTTLTEALANVTKDAPLTEVNESVWPATTPVYYDGNFYANIDAAIEAANIANSSDVAKIYVRPNCNGGLISAAHQGIKTSIAIYGNNASLDYKWEPCVENNGEQYHQLTKNISIEMYHLHDGAGVWGQRMTGYTVDVTFENCKNVHEFMINGEFASAAGSVTNYTITSCTFDGSKNAAGWPIATTSAGTIRVTDCEFENVLCPANINNKNGGDNTVIFTNSTFSNCYGNENDPYLIRVIGKNASSSMNAQFEKLRFTGTGENYSDIMIGSNEPNKNLASVSYTVTGTFGKMNTYKIGSTSPETTTLDNTAVGGSNTLEPVARIGNKTYTSLVEAIAEAQQGDTIILLKSITISDAAKGNTAGIIEISKKVTISGDGHTTITVAQPNGDAQKASAFNILSGGDVKFQNVVIDGNKTAKHGINVFGGKVELDTVTLQNFTGYGIVVQGAAAATNLTTKNNGWGGVNVDVNSYTNNSEFTMISGNVESVVVEHSNTNTTYTSRAAISGGTVGIAIIKQGDKAVTKLNGAALSITGGTFYEDVSDYVADGVAVARVDYSTEGKTVYIVGGDAIAEAINTATNEEITVINGGTIDGVKVGKTIRISKNLGKAIKSGDSTLIINGEKVTLKEPISDFYEYEVPNPTNPEPDPKPEPKPDPKPERPVRRYPTNNTTTTTDTKTDSVTSARTFDAGVALYVGMSALSLTSSAALLGKKKEF